MSSSALRLATIVGCQAGLTVQGGERFDLAGFGVPPGGAADRGALRLTNRLLGNPPDTPALESTLGGTRLRFEFAATLVVGGAPAAVTIGQRPAPMWEPVPVRAGDEVYIAVPTRGVRVYVAVRGGVADPRSRFTARVLAPGDALVGAGVVTGVPSATDVVPPPPIDDALTVRCTPGPRADWFTAASLATLVTATWTVLPDSDRVGIRLGGPQLDRRVAGELASEGVVRGSLQVPPDGRPVVLFADHPLTGGYPVIAVVDDHGCDALAQARPGTEVTMKWSR